MMIIKAIVHPAEEGGYWAEVPSLPGCLTQGESIEELRENLQEAIELYLEATNPESTEDKADQILEFAV
jgi:predicted RNase H-like HicB family nuclease